MFAVYLACLIFGGALLAFSLIFGGDHSDIDTDHSLDFDHSMEIEADHSLDFDHSVEIEADHDLEMDHSGELHLDTDSAEVEMQADHQIEHQADEHSGDAVKFLSIRNITYFLAFFGLTGTIFSLFELAPLITLIASVTMGSFVYMMGYRFMKYLKASESGEAFSIYSLKGKTGTVLINVSKERKGKIVVTSGDQTHQILAQASDIASKDTYLPGEKVLIIEVKPDHVYVVDSNL